MPQQQVIESEQVSRRRAGLALSTTKALFYVLGITQPSPEAERSVAAGFWLLVAALAIACAIGTMIVLKSVSLVG